jgi:hypothetical protein
MSEGARIYEESQQMNNYLKKYPESDPFNDEEYFRGMEESPDYVKQKKEKMLREKIIHILTLCHFRTNKKLKEK